jgi:hypothetical protein
MRAPENKMHQTHLLKDLLEKEFFYFGSLKESRGGYSPWRRSVRRVPQKEFPGVP